MVNYGEETICEKKVKKGYNVNTNTNTNTKYASPFTGKFF
jgi:hypothetical protein